MKIDITSKQTIAGVESNSASKLQQNNAKILFGKRAAKILKAFETYSKEKVVNTEAVDAVMEVLKTKNTVDLEKFAKTNVGKKFASNALKLANAKSPVALFAAIKAFKFPKALEKAASVAPAPTKTQRKARVTSAKSGSKFLSLPEIRKLLKSYGHSLKKQAGKMYILDSNKTVIGELTKPGKLDKYVAVIKGPGMSKPEKVVLLKTNGDNAYENAVTKIKGSAKQELTYL